MQGRSAVQMLLLGPAMKKTTKTSSSKLKVRKERVRSLTDDMVKRVHGGLEMSCCPGTEK